MWKVSVSFYWYFRGFRVFFVFFFFKQKTAYEIYQCDWSSDVCSSDLSRSRGSTGENRPRRNAMDIADKVADIISQQLDVEIGRASCRERV